MVKPARKVASSSCAQKPVGKCAVCGDQGMNREYGAPACLSCIVFFRRAVADEAKCKCHRDRNCEITERSRRWCRLCRFDKCKDVGMRPEAVRRHDLRGPRVRIQTQAPPDAPASAEADSGRLLEALVGFQKEQVSQHRNFFSEYNSPEVSTTNLDGNNRRRAIARDVNLSFKLCLTQAGEWGEQFAPYQQLSPESKKIILAEYGFAFLLIDLGAKTAREAEDEHWLLYNGTYMHPSYFRGLPVGDALKDGSREKLRLHREFVTELLTCISTPFRKLEVDDTECAALKTALLLTPSFSQPAIYSGQEDVVRNLNSQCMDELMEHCKKKSPERGAERCGEILLLLSSIRDGVKTLYNQTRVSDLFNLTQFDPFVRDALLT